jgi:CheY-like chemotaxis protein
MPVILLVEDNEDNYDIYATYLTHVGYEVVVATDGEVGVALARERRPALILMDIGLPGISGLDATRQLKCDPETSHIPIVALTAHALAEDRAAAAAAGCDLFLTKPIAPADLASQVRGVLAAHG